MQKTEFVTVEEYLALEEKSEIKHEYLGGVLYAMAGASLEHNRLTVNLLTALDTHLLGKACQVFVADVKVRLRLGADDVFYYPDVVVTCDPRDASSDFLRYPKLIIEVLSETTERIDRREKFLSYMRIESLEEYILVAHDKLQVTIFRRSSNWEPEVLTKPDEIARFKAVDFSMPLSAIYDRVIKGG